MAAVAADVLIPAENLTPRWGRPRRPPPLGKLTDAERRELEQIEAELDAEGIDRRRPRVRSDCPPDTEPCPFVSCRHHLALDLTPTGKIKLRWPHLEVWQMKETCSLRVADRGEHDGEAVAKLLGFSRAQGAIDLRRAQVAVRKALEQKPKR